MLKSVTRLKRACLVESPGYSPDRKARALIEAKKAAQAYIDKTRKGHSPGWTPTTAMGVARLNAAEKLLEAVNSEIETLGINPDDPKYQRVSAAQRRRASREARKKGLQQPVYQQPVQQPVQQSVYQQPVQQPVYQQPIQQPVPQPKQQRRAPGSYRELMQMPNQPRNLIPLDSMPGLKDTQKEIAEMMQRSPEELQSNFKKSREELEDKLARVVAYKLAEKELPGVQKNTDQFMSSYMNKYQGLMAGESQKFNQVIDNIQTADDIKKIGQKATAKEGDLLLNDIGKVQFQQELMTQRRKKREQLLEQRAQRDQQRKGPAKV